jgi:Zn ribbon nucleic-acid-binding protein
LSELSAADRCDRCGAQARVRAVLPGGGDLVFCGHHAREYDEQLRKVAVEIIDHSDEIDNTTSPAREF